MTATLHDLTRMTQTDLDDQFRRGRVGDIPDGHASGILIAGPGTPVERPILRLAGWFAWQGKVVYRSRGYLLNKVGPFGWHLVKA
ncbi:MAG: hypothetical protein M3069_03855, partial [Chloroflexota bacterium]|nr:hypothetical protein [Chloroflexota bacterium]